MEIKKSGIHCKNINCNKIIAETIIDNGISFLSDDSDDIKILSSERKHYIICPHCKYKNYFEISGAKLNNIRISHAEK